LVPSTVFANLLPKVVPNPGALAAQENAQTASFVTGLYFDVLNRQPTQTEVNDWVSNINVLHLAPDQVVQRFLGSSDYLTNQIVNDYQQFLGRAPEIGAVDTWLQQIFVNNLTAQQVTARFLASPEYFAKQGGTNVSWLSGLYHDLLGRLPDSA